MYFLIDSNMAYKKVYDPSVHIYNSSTEKSVGATINELLQRWFKTMSTDDMMKISTDLWVFYGISATLGIERLSFSSKDYIMTVRTRYADYKYKLIEVP